MDIIQVGPSGFVVLTNIARSPTDTAFQQHILEPLSRLQQCQRFLSRRWFSAANQQRKTSSSRCRRTRLILWCARMGPSESLNTWDCCICTLAVVPPSSQVHIHRDTSRQGHQQSTDAWARMSSKRRGTMKSVTWRLSCRCISGRCDVNYPSQMLTCCDHKAPARVASCFFKVLFLRTWQAATP